MRCSLSPFARASLVCILRQLAQPLIWEARISTSPMRLGSRLEAMASDVAVHFFMSSGAAAKRSLAVMVRFLLWFDIMTSQKPHIVVRACRAKKFGPALDAGATNLD